MILSGYSSRIFEIMRVPIPEPVPPPSEWVSWKPCNTQTKNQNKLATEQSPLHSVYLKQLCLKTERKQETFIYLSRWYCSSEGK